jgi:hypothetical protein
MCDCRSTKCSKYGLETWLTPNDVIRICLFDMQRSWSKNEIWDLKWSKWCIYVSHFLINNHFGAGHEVYICTPWAPNIEIMYFMFDWSTYRLFVVKTGWKRKSLQIIIFIYVCLTCSVVELKTLFETWITWNDVNCVYFLHFSYLITLTAYLGSQWAPKFQIKYFIFDSLIYRILVLNSGWKRTYTNWWFSYMFVRHAA